MSIKPISFIIIAIILLSFLLGAFLYPSFPDKVASHWNLNGEVNGYMGKFWGLFLLPIISTLIFLLFIFLPKIDPLKGIGKFRKEYDLLILFIVLELTFFYVLSVAWNLGARFDFGRFAAPAIGILFFFIGVILPKTKRNWFAGIRTPWTLSSDKVWEKTHRHTGVIFKTTGVIACLGVFFPKIAFFAVIVPIFPSVIWLFVYSYLEYRKEGHS